MLHDNLYKHLDKIVQKELQICRQKLLNKKAMLIKMTYIGWNLLI